MEEKTLLHKMISICESLDPRVCGPTLLKRIVFMGHELEHKVAAYSEPLDKLKAFSEYFYKEQKFVCENEKPHTPLEWLLLSSVLQSKRGLPLSLGVIFSSLIKKHGIELKNINFPGSRLLKWVRNDECTYIDLVDEGRILSSTEIIEFLKDSKSKAQEKLFETLPDEDVFIAYLTKLKEYYLTNNFTDQAFKIYEKILQIRPNTFSTIKERALLYYELGRTHEALHDLKKYFSFSNTEKVTPDLVELYFDLSRSENQLHQ